MWARVTSLRTGCKVRDAGKDESELNRKHRLDRARNRSSIEQRVDMKSWEQVLVHDSNQRVRKCERIRRKKAIYRVYPHARLGTGLYDVFIIRCRGLGAQVGITDGRLTPCKRDELSVAAGYALISALETWY